MKKTTLIFLNILFLKENKDLYSLITITLFVFCKLILNNHNFTALNKKTSKTVHF